MTPGNDTSKATSMENDCFGPRDVVPHLEMAQLLPKPHLSNFERLPRELRDQIYGYLLVSTEVKVNRMTCFLPTYRFHTAILAANRNISEEAQAVLFKRNTFIVVSHSWSGFGSCMYQERVPSISKLGGKTFTQHHLSIHIDFSGVMSQPEGFYQSFPFIMVAEDLPRFAHCLRILNLARGGRGGLRINLEVRATETSHPRPALQKRLLEPFKELHGASLTATLEGAVDSEYAAEVLQAMMPTFSHDESRVRADQWHMYRLAQTMKIKGDELFTAGDLPRARERYSRVLLFEQECQHGFLEGWIEPDHEFRASKDNLLIRTEINHRLAFIRLRDFAEADVLRRPQLANFDRSGWLRDSERARLLLYVAIGLSEADLPSVAVRCLREALVYSPGDMAVRECLRRVESVDLDCLRRGGDSVLGAATDGDLFIEEPGEDEGELAYYRSVKDGIVDD